METVRGMVVDRCELPEGYDVGSYEMFQGRPSVVLYGGEKIDICSPIPWNTYTHISHTNSGKKDNATPLFDWRKYCEKDGKIVMPVSVQNHHSFVDGIHIGQFADMLHIVKIHWSCFYQRVMRKLPLRILWNWQAAF